MAVGLLKLLRAPWGALGRGVYEYNVLRHLRTLQPRQLQVNVTYRCNARCAMCNIWQMPERHEMSVDEMGRVAEDPIFESIERLTLAGGEPSLRHDLVPLTEVLLARMPRLRSVTLITNGLAVERILDDTHKLLALCGPLGISLNVSVSLDGVGAIHDEMRNVPGAFGKVERCLVGLQELQREQRFWFGASCVITRKNLYHLVELQDWCAERNIELSFQLVGFHETYVANVEQRSELDFDQDDQEHLFRFLSGLAAGRSPTNVMPYYWNDMLKMYRDGRPRQTPCPFTVDSFVLDVYGDMYYCLSERRIGNCLDAASDNARFDGCSAVYYDRGNLAFRAGLWRTACQRCNSGCFVNVGIKKDLKKHLWYWLTGR